MKKVFIIAFLCFPLLLGCTNVDATRSPAPPIAAGHSQNSGQSQGPDYAGLIEEYRSMLQEDPRNLAAIIALGNAYLNNRRWSDAIRLYEQSLESDPRNAEVYTNMGTAYRYVGKPVRAIAAYRQAVNNDPGNMDARYNMGAVYAFDMKQYDTALHLWEDLLRLAPNYPLAGNMRALMGAFRKALQKAGS
jgi:cytochrome c-type biogenesis protein CcmH/NrfG